MSSAVGFDCIEGPRDPDAGALIAAIELVATLDSQCIAGLSDAALIALSRDAERLSRHVATVQVAAAHAVRARSDAAFGERRLDHRLGAKGAVEALMLLTNAPRRQLRDRLRLADAVLPRDAVTQTLPASHPVLAEAFLEARIGIDAALEIEKHLESIALKIDPDELDQAESILVDHAAEQPFDTIGALASRIRDLVDPDGSEPRDDLRRQMRYLRLTQQANGMLKISGLADPESAARLLDALGPTEQTGPVFRSIEEERAERDPRTPSQRMFDRLVEVTTAGAESLVTNRAARRRSRERIVITATLDDFESGDGVATFLGTKQVIPIARLRELAASQGANGVETALFGAEGRVLALGRGRFGRGPRSFTETQRFALTLRDGATCSRTGCSRPAAECDAHHIVPWAQGGQTDVDNGVLLCSYHHWLLHQAGGTIVAAGGRAHYRPPAELHSRWQRLGDPPPPRIRRRAPRPAA